MRENDRLCGNWYVQRQIGQGSYGTVYLAAKKTEAGIKYSACKEVCIDDDYNDSLSVTEGLNEENAAFYFNSVFGETLRETEILKKLSGAANICRGLEHNVVVEDGRKKLFLFLEYLTPLNDLLAERELSLQTVIDLGIDMCTALEECGEKHILHRDIKYDNILYSKSEKTFKLGDFGVSCELGVNSFERVGRLSYMSPDIYHGRPYGYSDDLYSLCIVLYKLVNENRIPFLPNFPANFSKDARDTAIFKRLNGDTVPLPVTSNKKAMMEVKNRSLNGLIESIIARDQFDAAEKLGKIICRGLSYDRAERYETCSALKYALGQVLENTSSDTAGV